MEKFAIFSTKPKKEKVANFFCKLKSDRWSLFIYSLLLQVHVIIRAFVYHS